MRDVLWVRSYTFPALVGAAEAIQAGVGALHDDDAIKTSIATATSAQVYSGGGLNGVIAGNRMRPRRGITVTTGASGATYNTANAISIAGYVYVKGIQTAKTVTALLTQAGGGETIDFSGGLDQVVSISVPAQSGTGGTFKFGVGDLYADIGDGTDGVRESDPFRGILGMGAGNLKVSYSGNDDLFATADGRYHGVTPSKIYRVGTTVTAFQVLV